MVKISVIGPAAWKARDYEENKMMLPHGDALHPGARSLISGICELLPASAFEIDRLTQDGFVSTQLLRVYWISPAGARESRVVFGWNGMLVLEPS